MKDAEILEKLFSGGGHIAALRGPTTDYRDFISLCIRDGPVTGTLSREFLSDLIEVNFVKQDGPENESGLTIFKLTDDIRRGAGSPLKRFLKSKLIRLGYPWPEHLETKTIDWLKTEIRSITTAARRAD